jgi:hypothetical protein
MVTGGLIADGDRKFGARFDHHGLGDRAVLGRLVGRLPVDGESEPVETGVAGREVEGDVDRLRDGRRIRHDVLGPEVGVVSAVPEQAFLLRIVIEIDGDAAARWLDGPPGPRFVGRDVVDAGMELVHGRAPVALHLLGEVLAGGGGAHGDSPAQEEPGYGRDEDDPADGEKSKRSHGWIGLLVFVETKRKGTERSDLHDGAIMAPRCEARMKPVRNGGEFSLSRKESKVGEIRVAARWKRLTSGVSR